MLILGVVVVFCCLVLAVLVVFTAAFLGDPEFQFEDDLQDEREWKS